MTTEEKQAFNTFAAAALQGLISKLPLVDRDGEYSDKKTQEEVDQVKTDIARSALSYARLMMKHKWEFE